MDVNRMAFWKPHRVLMLAVIFIFTVASRGDVAASRHVFVGAQENGVGGVNGLDFAWDVIVTPDGAHGYVSGLGDNRIAIFSRGVPSGALSFLSTATAPVLSGPSGMAVSSDGEFVYVGASTTPSAIVAFTRDSGSGQLTFMESHSSTDLPGLLGAAAVKVSPDDKNVYVTGVGADSIVVFARDAMSGELTYVETQTDGVGGVDGINRPIGLVISDDGLHVYVAGEDDDAIAIFARDGGTGALTYVGMVQQGVGGVDGLHLVRSITITGDGAHVYATGEAASLDEVVAEFGRNAGTGALTFIGTASASITLGIDGVTAAPDGKHVYTAYSSVRALAVFSRNATTGNLTFTEEFRDDVGGVAGLGGAFAVTVSPNSEDVYVASQEGAVATFRKIAVSCTSSAKTGCFTPAIAGKSRLVIKDDPIDSRDKLIWKWLKGPALTPGDFGDPVTTLNDYALCLYSSAGGAILEDELLAPAGGGCKKPTDGGALPCWRAIPGKGFKYARKTRHPDGVTPVKLLAGAVAGQSKVLFKAKGEAVPMPALPMSLPLTVQVQNADGTCWEAVHTTATFNAGVFTASD